MNSPFISVSACGATVVASRREQLTDVSGASKVVIIGIGKLRFI